MEPGVETGVETGRETGKKSGIESSGKTGVETTLYPKITNHIHEVIKTLKQQNRNPEQPENEVVLEPVPIVGTVKLHGTHGDILVYRNNTIIFQSRNNVSLLPTADNQGFAAAMATKQTAILRLRDRYLTQWRAMHPFGELDTGLPITISGEWCGAKIQKGVAISELSKRFVIISVKINGSWVADTEYADVESPEGDIYNISRGGTYHSTLYPEDPQRTMHELEALAEKVAKRCPFAGSFGVAGEGEGLVWKLVPWVEKSELWFKTKGGRFKPTFTPAPKKTLSSSEAEKRDAAAVLAKAWCSVMRMEQGWDYLREKGIVRNMRGIGEFLKWVQHDIEVEEAGSIEEHKIDRQMLRLEIVGIAKPWYLERYSKGEN